MKSFMKKKMKKSLSTRLVLFIILLSIGSSTFSGEKLSPIGNVMVSEGLSHVIRNGEKHPVKRGLRLFKSDRLVTGVNTRLRFRLVDGSLITLGENTEFDLVNYQFQNNRKTGNKAEFQLTQGVFRFISGLITKQKDPDLKVLTPVATIGIRGTDFWGGYLDADAVDVLLIESEHKLFISNDLGVVTLDQNGSGTTVRKNSAPTKPKNWPEAKVNRALQTIMMDE